MEKTLKIKDLTEQEINLHIATLVLKYPEQGFKVFISDSTGKCVARKSTGNAPCEYEERSCDFAALWDPIRVTFADVPQLIPENLVESLRYVLILRYGETLDIS